MHQNTHYFIIVLLLVIVSMCLYLNFLNLQNETYSQIIYEAGQGPMKTQMQCKYQYDDAISQGCCVDSSHRVVGGCKYYEKDWGKWCNEKCQDKSQSCKIQACINNETLNKCLLSEKDCDPQVIRRKELEVAWRAHCQFYASNNIEACVQQGVASNAHPGAGFDPQGQKCPKGAIFC